MRFQSHQSSCGPAALFNAGCALGKKLSLEECEAACGTTTDGTDVKQLKRGAQKLGLEVMYEIKVRESEHAAWALLHWLCAGHSAIVCVDGDSHWVAAVGCLGERLLVADSADNELVVSYHVGELLSRWKGAGRKPYYALVLG